MTNLKGYRQVNRPLEYSMNSDFPAESRGRAREKSVLAGNCVHKVLEMGKLTSGVCKLQEHFKMADAQGA